MKTMSLHQLNNLMVVSREEWDAVGPDVFFIPEENVFALINAKGGDVIQLAILEQEYTRLAITYHDVLIIDYSDTRVII